jgi:hypothetical protein
MSNFTTVTGSVDSSDKKIPLGAEVWIDNTCVVNVEHVDRVICFSHQLPDDDSQHELRIVMKHKTADHTDVNELGEIVRDAVLTIADIKFDDIALGHTFLEKTVYTHNFNGTRDSIDDRFFGDMGCNGTVSLKFSTPAHLWMLDNM